MPRVHGISRDFAANPWSRHPFTKTLAHMQPVPKQFVPDKASIKLMRLDPFAKVKDRIKYWNFMPGDRVRVRGSKDQRMMEVAQVNKLTNHVRLREIPDEEAEEKINTTEPIEDLLKVHYSRLQLYWRHETLPGKEEPEPIFVTRIARGGIKWKPEGGSQGSYMYWRRYPLATSPPLPKEQIRKVEIPWPTVEIDRLEKQAQIGYVMEKYITKPETVTALTYTPPGKPVIMHASSPRWMHQYLRTLYNPGYDRAENGPYEISLQRELSNPYSRAKRQARWQARHKYRKLLLSQIMKEELKNLDGRTRREARAEAVFRWKAQLVREEQADHRRRKAKRGDFARETRKRMRRRAKEQERAEILRKLVLQEGPNQVIPGRRQPASTA